MARWVGYGEESRPSEIVRVQHRDVSLLALLGKDECTLVIVIHCLDCHILILQYVICILFREELVSKFDVGFGIDVRETLRQTFGLGASYIGRSVVLRLR